MQAPMLHGTTARRQLSAHSIALALFIPFAFFMGTFNLLSGEIYYNHPHDAMLILGLAFVVDLVIGAFALQAHRKWQKTGEGSWFTFIFLTILLALGLGQFLGYLNFRVNTRRYYDYMSLRRVIDVDPTHVQGQGELDAGTIDFTAGTHVDRSFSMAYHKQRTWCVAPIVSGKDPLANYDFWAVGMDCCSTKPGDFSCGPNYVQRSENGMAIQPKGLRVLEDSELQGYKLAVDMAAAQYDIQSRRPIFLYLMEKPYEAIKEFSDGSATLTAISGVFFFLLQCVLVYRQAEKFGKGERSGYMDIEKSKHKHMFREQH